MRPFRTFRPFGAVNSCNTLQPVEQRTNRFHARMRERVARSDLDRHPIALVHHREAFLVRQVVADKHRPAARERRLIQKGHHRAAFIDILRLDFVDHLAGLQHVRIGILGDQLLGRLARRRAALRRIAIMQRERRTLDLQQHAGIGLHHASSTCSMRSRRSSLKPTRWTSAFESRRSAPCKPATGRSGMERNESMLSIPRPDTIATAPLVARRNAPRMAGTTGCTVTPSGVGASSTSVPSKSKKKAVVASGKLSGRFCIYICLSAGEGPEKCAHVTALCNPVWESGVGPFDARSCGKPTPCATYRTRIRQLSNLLRLPFSLIWPPC